MGHSYPCQWSLAGTSSNFRHKPHTLPDIDFPSPYLPAYLALFPFKPQTNKLTIYPPPTHPRSARQREHPKASYRSRPCRRYSNEKGEAACAESIDCSPLRSPLPLASIERRSRQKLTKFLRWRPRGQRRQLRRRRRRMDFVVHPWLFGGGVSGAGVPSRVPGVSGVAG